MGNANALITELVEPHWHLTVKGGEQGGAGDANGLIMELVVPCCWHPTVGVVEKVAWVMQMV